MNGTRESRWDAEAVVLLLIIAALVAIAAGSMTMGQELHPGESATLTCSECPAPDAEACADRCRPLVEDCISRLDSCEVTREACLEALPCPEAEVHDPASWVCLQQPGPGVHPGPGVGAGLGLHPPGLPDTDGAGAHPPTAVRRGAWIVGAVILGAVIYHYGKRHGGDDVTNVFIDNCHGRCD